MLHLSWDMAQKPEVGKNKIKFLNFFLKNPCSTLPKKEFLYLFFGINLKTKNINFGFIK